MNALALSPQLNYTLKALTGPEKGSVFKLIADRVTIGRGTQNDISVPNDVRMSRQHAVITITASRIDITDVSGHKTMLINGTECETSEISSGYTLQLGDTKFHFLAQAADADKSMVTATSLDFDKQNSGLARPSPRKKKDKAVFYAIVVGLIVLFTWLLSAKVANKVAPLIRTEEAAQVNIDANRKTIEKAQEEGNTPARQPIRVVR